MNQKTQLNAKYALMMAWQISNSKKYNKWQIP